MKTTAFILLAALALATLLPPAANACTGITLKAKDGTNIVARTIEWGGSDLNSQYVVVPRGYAQQSLTPDGGKGMAFTAQYGYVGLAVEREAFVAEGINEAGLAAGLFYFPGYGKYESFDPVQKEHSIADLQLVSWILGQCKTVDEVKEELQKVRVVAIYPQASTVHWRFTDVSGRQIVLEIIDETPVFYENKLGVLTNSPGFDWQMTNLNNYINLKAGTVAPVDWNGTALRSPGIGSGLLGLPGDITPPSRFVRAAFMVSTAPNLKSADETVLYSFKILNAFEIPIGLEEENKANPIGLLSATQWSSATDMTNGVIYYKTMNNARIRSVDLKTINFGQVTYQSLPIDKVKSEPIEKVVIR